MLEFNFANKEKFFFRWNLISQMKGENIFRGNLISRMKDQFVKFAKFSDNKVSQSLMFFVETLYCQNLPMSTKGCSGLFSFYLKFELCICQNKQRPDFYTLTETRFTNNSNLNKVKKIPSTLLQTLERQKSVQNFSKNVKLYRSSSSSEQFFMEITQLLGNKRVLSKFKNQILHHLISIIKLQNKYSVKPNFILTTQATSIFEAVHERDKLFTIIYQ